ncbi:hypothetical protein ACIBP6_08300 [Nonomuraea terrae]|uniref:hypothetical protein n=1 Tax=Nonomuraea terrae TaxID=2530383 RepID=UPI00378A8680
MAVARGQHAERFVETATGLIDGEDAVPQRVGNLGEGREGVDACARTATGSHPDALSQRRRILVIARVCDHPLVAERPPGPPGRRV